MTSLHRKIKIQKYTPSDQAAWDSFVARSRTRHFLFLRNYMNYHSDRFEDESLLIYVDNQLVALLPASDGRDVLASHGGLTFGGFITDTRMSTNLMLDVVAATIEFLRDNGTHKVIYKAVPHIYHIIPAEEDLYALFINDAKLTRRDLSSTIRVADHPGCSKGRRAQVKRFKREGLRVSKSHDFIQFMELEKKLLNQKYGVEPVHSADELALLADRFPDNIKLFVTTHNDTIVAGVVTYETPVVVHTQYIASNELGRKLGAVDGIVDSLLEDQFSHKRYFDFGISTEQDGRHLNVGLTRNKESYGARATTYDRYELTIKT